MSYTVFINGINLIDGKSPLSSLAETSASFHDPNSKRNPEGYVSCGGKTTVGVVWIPENTDEFKRVGKNLSQRPELNDGLFQVRIFELGSYRVGVANFLIPHPNLEFLKEVFEGTKSSFWGMEQAVWYVGKNNDMSITPPWIVKPEGISPMVIFPMGAIDWYFKESLKDHPLVKEYYSNETRGYEFRRKYSEESAGQVMLRYFAEIVEKYGYDKAMQKLVTREGTGLAHGSTILYFNSCKGTLDCAHLKHESTADWCKYRTTDNEGNELVITRSIPAEYFLNHWPYKIIESLTAIEGVYIQSVLESQMIRQERSR